MLFEGAIWWIIVGILGACFGSFATLLSWRLPREQSVLTARSRCPQCETALGPRDLFPLLSWMFAGGGCRHCGAKVPLRYPLTELATAAVFLLVYWHSGATVNAALLALLGFLFVVLTVTDLEHTIIPDEIQFAIGAFGILFAMWNDFLWPEAIIGGVTGFAIGCLLHYGYYWLRKRHGLGFGDVKFLGVFGLWLGGAVVFIPYLFFAGIVGTLMGVVWKLCFKQGIFPFGPALAWVGFAGVLYPEVFEAFWVFPNFLAMQIIQVS